MGPQRTNSFFASVNKNMTKKFGPKYAEISKYFRKKQTKSPQDSDDENSWFITFGGEKCRSFIRTIIESSYGIYLRF